MEPDGHLASLHECLVVVPGALTVLLRPHSLGYAARAAEDRRASLLLDASDQGTPVNSKNVATNEERPFYYISSKTANEC